MSDEEPRRNGAGRHVVSMPICPMGDLCKRMMERPPSSLLIFLPGTILIVVGVLIAIEPDILVWLIAAGSILMGIAMLGCAYFMHTIGAGLTRTRR